MSSVALSVERQKPPALLQAEREAWQMLAESRCGTYFADGRFHILEAQIRLRMKALGQRSSRDYLHLASADTAAGRAEWKQLLPLILNGDTAFFRHRDSFDALSSMVLPTLLREPEKAQIAIWCAGCSTGEEAYSIAAVALSHGLEQAAVRILGTDVNEAALAIARQGIYDRSGIPDDVRGRSLRQISRARLQQVISFASCNLMHPETYPQQQDLIWCQNVLIYCRDSCRSRIVAGFEESLRPGGYLLLSPVDAMCVRPAHLEPVQAGHVRLYKKAR